jgi:hypothetical protein
MYYLFCRNCRISFAYICIEPPNEWCIFWVHALFHVVDFFLDLFSCFGSMVQFHRLPYTPACPRLRHHHCNYTPPNGGWDEEGRCTGEKEAGMEKWPSGEGVEWGRVVPKGKVGRFSLSTTAAVSVPLWWRQRRGTLPSSRTYALTPHFWHCGHRQDHLCEHSSSVLLPEFFYVPSLCFGVRLTNNDASRRCDLIQDDQLSREDFSLIYFWIMYFSFL